MTISKTYGKQFTLSGLGTFRWVDTHDSDAHNGRIASYLEQADILCDTVVWAEVSYNKSLVIAQAWMTSKINQ